MQVDPIKPTLTAPGTERLKLKYYKLLSGFAFNLNLRRYIEVLKWLRENGSPWDEWTCAWAADGGQLKVGAYTRPLFGST